MTTVNLKLWFTFKIKNKKECVFMKKITAVLLAVMMLFTALCFSASAADGEDVARMWICSEKSDNSGVGHIFLYFENLTDKTITVGKYKLEGKGDVSVGCFGTEGPWGAGVYYNLETELDHYSQLIGLSTLLTEDELAEVTKKLKSFDRWDPIFNCNYFALLGWNAGTGSSIPFLIFPQFTRLFIRLRNGVSNPFDLYSRNVTVYKQSRL